MNGIKTKELCGVEPMGREALVVLAGEVRADVIGLGDCSVLLDFSPCVGPRTTRSHVREWVRDRGLTEFHEAAAAAVGGGAKMKIIIHRTQVPPVCGPWHRHLLRESLELNDGWVLGESSSAVLVQFADSDDWINFARGVAGHDVKALPMSDLRLYVCLPYVAGCKLCDEGALYHED